MRPETIRPRTSSVAGRREFLRLAVAAAVAAPVAVVLHELGHWFVALAFDFPDLTLRYGSVSHGAVEAGVPNWQRGLQAAAGPAVTLLLVLACCVVAARRRVQLLTLAGGIAAGVRGVIVGVLYVPARLLDPHAVREGNFDELNTALAFGIAPDLVVGANLLLLISAWWFLITRVPRSQRLGAVSATAAGIAAGLTVYIGWLGPMLLP